MPAMETRNLSEHRRWSAEKMAKSSVFQTERLYYDLYCLEPGQAQKVHKHEGSDKVYLVLDGRVMGTVGSEERELSRDQAVLAPAGEPHGVRNHTSERAALLV